MKPIEGESKGFSEDSWNTDSEGMRELLDWVNISRGNYGFELDHGTVEGIGFREMHDVLLSISTNIGGVGHNVDAKYYDPRGVYIFRNDGLKHQDTAGAEFRDNAQYLWVNNFGPMDSVNGRSWRYSQTFAPLFTMGFENITGAIRFPQGGEIKVLEYNKVAEDLWSLERFSGRCDQF